MSRETRGVDVEAVREVIEMLRHAATYGVECLTMDEWADRLAAALRAPSEARVDIKAIREVSRRLHEWVSDYQVGSWSTTRSLTPTSLPNSLAWSVAALDAALSAEQPKAEPASTPVLMRTINHLRARLQRVEEVRREVDVAATGLDFSLGFAADAFSGEPLESFLGHARSVLAKLRSWAARLAEDAPEGRSRPSLESLLAEVAAWAHAAFPTSTPESKSRHLAREAAELAANPRSAEEMADVLMILGHLAADCGVDLVEAVREKFAVVKDRVWQEPDGEGVIEHVRESPVAGGGLPRRSEEPGCPGEGRCHGPVVWCNRCGRVEDVCDHRGCHAHSHLWYDDYGAAPEPISPAAEPTATEAEEGEAETQAKDAEGHEAAVLPSAEELVKSLNVSLVTPDTLRAAKRQDRLDLFAAASLAGQRADHGPADDGSDIAIAVADAEALLAAVERAEKEGE